MFGYNGILVIVGLLSDYGTVVISSLTIDASRVTEHARALYIEGLVLCGEFVVIPECDGPLDSRARSLECIMVIPIVGVAIVKGEQESALVGYCIGKTYQMSRGRVNLSNGVSTSLRK